jgi:excisionase family DNA binding protein
VGARLLGAESERRLVSERLLTARSPALRLALSPDEASAALGVSRDFFDEHIAPELRIVRRGRRRLVPIGELERWLDRSAARAYDEAVN